TLSFQSRPRPGLVPFGWSVGPSSSRGYRTQWRFRRNGRFKAFAGSPGVDPAGVSVRPRWWLAAPGTRGFHRPLSDLRAEPPRWMPCRAVTPARRRPEPRHPEHAVGKGQLSWVVRLGLLA